MFSLGAFTFSNDAVGNTLYIWCNIVFSPNIIRYIIWNRHESDFFNGMIIHWLVKKTSVFLPFIFYLCFSELQTQCEMLLHRPKNIFMPKNTFKLSVRLMQKKYGSICDASHSRIYERNFRYMVVHITVRYIVYLNYLLPRLLGRYQQQCKESWYMEGLYFLSAGRMFFSFFNAFCG